MTPTPDKKDAAAREAALKRVSDPALIRRAAEESAADQRALMNDAVERIVHQVDGWLLDFLEERAACFQIENELRQALLRFKEEVEGEERARIRKIIAGAHDFADRFEQVMRDLA